MIKWINHHKHDYRKSSSRWEKMPQINWWTTHFWTITSEYCFLGPPEIYLLRTCVMSGRVLALSNTELNWKYYLENKKCLLLHGPPACLVSIQPVWELKLDLQVKCLQDQESQDEKLQQTTGHVQPLFLLMIRHFNYNVLFSYNVYHFTIHFTFHLQF